MKEISKRNYSKGITCKDCDKKIKNTSTYCKSCANKGKKNCNWKETGIKYVTLHAWIRRNKKKPERCPMCNHTKKRLEAHNISGKYKRDINDYIWLCTKCHNQVEKHIEKRRIREMGDLKL